MNFSEAKRKIQTGDMLAWSHYDWSTWYDLQVQAVRIGTESEYCHVALAQVDQDGVVWVIESVVPVVRRVPLSAVLSAHGCYWAPLKTDFSPAETAYLKSVIGVAEYSKIDAVMAQLNLLTLGASSKLECAELFILARRLSGLDFGPKATPAAVVAAVLDAGHELCKILPDKEISQ